MKQIYCCELCGEIYETQEECERCEQSHIGPVGIEAGAFRPVNKAISPYLYKVVVHMEDDKYAQYLFDKVVDKPEKLPHPSEAAKEEETK